MRKIRRPLGILVLVLMSSMAEAQPLDVHDAATTAATQAPVPAPRATPRSDPGPALRERGGRTRRANPASGVLLVLGIVGAMGWYVAKRFRR